MSWPSEGVSQRPPPWHNLDSHSQQWAGPRCQLESTATASFIPSFYPTLRLRSCRAATVVPDVQPTESFVVETRILLLVYFRTRTRSYLLREDVPC